jgi:hypothetical protein
MPLPAGPRKAGQSPAWAATVIDKRMRKAEVVRENIVSLLGVFAGAGSL